MAGENLFIMNNNWLISNETQNFIKSEGYNIHLISDIYNLKKVILRHKPDVIIVEIIAINNQLTKLLEEIRGIEELANIPQIAVVSHAKKDTILMLAQMGFEEILLKPIDKNTLLLTIEKLSKPVESGKFLIRDELTEDGFTIIEFLDHLDVTNSTKVDNFIDHMIRKGRKCIIFDFRKISYIDSSGIGILLLCKKKLDLVNGYLKVANINESIKHVFDSLHLEKIIDIVEIELEESSKMQIV